MFHPRHLWSSGTKFQLGFSKKSRWVNFFFKCNFATFKWWQMLGAVNTSRRKNFFTVSRWTSGLPATATATDSISTLFLCVWRRRAAPWKQQTLLMIKNQNTSKILGKQNVSYVLYVSPCGYLWDQTIYDPWIENFIIGPRVCTWWAMVQQPRLLIYGVPPQVDHPPK